uniref:Uncharacterized protein n=1 Tax=Kalanchoe fedtschenkoi TaxID=63787 RepID=A0A7N0TJZ1_KALFE
MQFYISTCLLLAQNSGALSFCELKPLIFRWSKAMGEKMGNKLIPHLNWVFPNFTKKPKISNPHPNPNPNPSLRWLSLVAFAKNVVVLKLQRGSVALQVLILCAIVVV